MPFSDFIANGKLDVSDTLDPLIQQFKSEHHIDQEPLSEEDLVGSIAGGETRARKKI